MPVKLPKPLSQYFAAANTDDADRVAACFAADAVVHDEGHDFHGRSAVRAWAQETRRKYRFYAEVRVVEAAGDLTIVTARLTGKFPGAPVDLRYRFKLAGVEIVSLNIS
jgi:ketosteroid isomerase-like protein